MNAIGLYYFSNSSASNLKETEKKHLGINPQLVDLHINIWKVERGKFYLKPEIYIDFGIMSSFKVQKLCLYLPFGVKIYEDLGKIQSGNKIWNIRRLNQWISVWTNLNIRDKPGLSGNKISLIKYEGPQLNYNVIEITEESEIIDGINDRWVKIEYEKGKYGWVFGGYVSVERGGPKYMIPENEIKFLVGQQP